MIPEYDNKVYDRSENEEIVLFILFFQKILKNIDAVAMVTDQKGLVKFASERFFGHFKLKQRNVLEKNWIDIMIPEDMKRAVNKLFISLKKEDKLVQFQVPVLREGKAIRDMLWTVSPLVNHNVEKMYFFIGAESGKIAGERAGKCLVKEKEVKKVRNKVSRLLFEASEKSDPDTAKHALRSMFFAELLARKVGLSVHKIENIKTAALLHDLGKLVVDPGVLLKKSKLTADEFEHIKKHIVWGADLLGRMYFLEDIVSIMCGHHENYDGRGYPQGIAGESIPLEARILSVADIYEALTANRPYREAFSTEEAIAIMEYEKGHKLDPRLTDIFVAMIREKERQV